MRTASFPLVESGEPSPLNKQQVPVDPEFEASCSRLSQVVSITLETEVVQKAFLVVRLVSNNLFCSRNQVPAAWRYLPIVLAGLKRRRRGGQAPLSVEKNERSICHDLCHIKLFFDPISIQARIG
jgi:hypothetical protein